MQGTCTVVVPPDTAIHDPGSVKLAIDQALEPFRADLIVAPFRVHLTHHEVEEMARFYRIQPTGLATLAAKMRDWRHEQGGVDDTGLYYVSQVNPCGKWDWWQYLPGRASFPVRLRNLPALDPTALALRTALAAACLLTTAVAEPTPTWLESRTLDPSTTEYKVNTRYVGMVSEVCRRLPNHLAVRVDFHRQGCLRRSELDAESIY